MRVVEDCGVQSMMSIIATADRRHARTLGIRLGGSISLGLRGSQLGGCGQLLRIFILIVQQGEGVGLIQRGVRVRPSSLHRRRLHLDVHQIKDIAS